jgi:dimethylaniline monooxygenase (N-oxide forming)
MSETGLSNAAVGELPRACIIGAGSSGIAAVKALQDRGIPFDCFEKSDRVGGNWVFGNKNGMSAAYRELFINVSRERMEYADFPMPKSIPDFPHHTHIARYFEEYVDHFGLRERISFETGVEHVSRREDGVWDVTLDNGETRSYDALLVANGHHWDQRWPEPSFPGSEDFQGVQMHAHGYTDNSVLAGKDVVVLGMGNSAMDIAVESSYVARSTYLAARQGAWIVPKYVFGKPVDQLPNDPRIPFKLRQRMIHQVIKAYTGTPESYGLPKPNHKFGEAHPTVSGRILDRIAHGTIVPKPNIARLEGEQVHFTDGSSVHADVVVYCTGYKITFPFFDQDFVAAPDNHIELFRRVFHPEIDGLYFIGLLQPLGAIMPLAEAQSTWVGDHLRGEYALPDPAQVRKDMHDVREAMRKRYIPSKRHTILFEYNDYLHDLDKERREGAERARLRGLTPPLPARAVVGSRAAAGSPAADAPPPAGVR